MKTRLFALAALLTLCIRASAAEITSLAGLGGFNWLKRMPRLTSKKWRTRFVPDEQRPAKPMLPAPEVIAREITDDLEAAFEQFATIAEDLKKLPAPARQRNCSGRPSGDCRRQLAQK
jgi:hypothetical protein